MTNTDSLFVGSPHDVAGDLGMGTRDRRRDPYDDDSYDEDDLYDEPLNSPTVGKEYDSQHGRGWRRE